MIIILMIIIMGIYVAVTAFIYWYLFRRVPSYATWLGWRFELGTFAVRVAFALVFIPVMVYIHLYEWRRHHD